MMRILIAAALVASAAGAAVDPGPEWASIDFADVSATPNSRWGSSALLRPML